MAEIKNIDKIISEIKEPEYKFISAESLKIAREALDLNERKQIEFFVEKLEKIIPKALNLRKENEAA
jgi:hypothetical protein